MIAVLVTAGFQAVYSDEVFRWFMPGKQLPGLSRKTESEAAAGVWTADVPELPWRFIVIHHSGGQFGSVESIHEVHRRRMDGAGNPWQGIGYHFVIGNGQGMKDGAIGSTFRWSEQLHGAHSGSELFNTRGIGICLVGNFEQAPPTKSQMESVRRLVRVLAIRHGIPRENIKGHASVKPTLCPGKFFPLDELKSVVPESRS